MVLSTKASDLYAADTPDRNGVWRGIFARATDAPEPDDNRANPAKIALGFQLFRDPRLSRDDTLACASCHQPERAFSDGLPRASARDGTDLPRNTPTLYNLAWSSHFFWDGRETSLETQARQPITDHREMAADLAVVAQRLALDRVSAALFSRAFPENPTVNETNILKALAAYERTLVAPESAFDRWVKGDDQALSPQQQRGFQIFVGRGGCVGCHGGWRFTDNGFHDIGLTGDDPGRSAVNGGVPGSPQFKTPGLRELAKTAPYMHDGSKPTLRSVIDHYASGLVKRPSLDSNMVRDLTLTDSEKADLEAFLLSASSTDP
jgi:cytochrome c peroxidase